MQEIIYTKDYEAVNGEVIPPYSNYSEYKKALDEEINREMEGFVKIGYLLKLARDTRILFESGYKDLYEFAEAEYKKDKSQVSRYIALNDMFSKEGYSMELEQQYKGFGYSKLVIMKNLPKELIGELSPEHSKTEIQTLKNEYDKEMEKTELEVRLEEELEETKSLNLLSKAVFLLGKDNKELFEVFYGIKENCQDKVKYLKDAISPDGNSIYIVRIEGLGRVTVKFGHDVIRTTPMRYTNEWEEFDWESLVKYLDSMLDGASVTEAYEKAYGIKLETPKEVAEVQKKPEKKPIKKQVKKPKIVPVEQEEQLPGQMEVADYPELMPEGSNNDVQTSDVDVEKKEDISEEVSGAFINPTEEATEENREGNEPKGEDDGASRGDYNEKNDIYGMSEEERGKRRESYIAAVEANLGDAEEEVSEKSWHNAKTDLMKAINYLDLLMELEKNVDFIKCGEDS